MFSLPPDPDIERVELVSGEDKKIVLSMGATTLGRGPFLGTQLIL